MKSTHVCVFNRCVGEVVEKLVACDNGDLSRELELQRGSCDVKSRHTSRIHPQNLIQSFDQDEHQHTAVQSALKPEIYEKTFYTDKVMEIASRLQCYAQGQRAFRNWNTFDSGEFQSISLPALLSPATSTMVSMMIHTYTQFFWYLLCQRPFSASMIYMDF